MGEQETEKPDLNEAVYNLRDVVLDELEKVFGPLLRWLNDRLTRT